MKQQILTTLVILAFSGLSFSMSQKPKAQNPPSKAAKVSGKSLGYFQTSLSKVENGNGDITLVARVLARNSMADSVFEWKTPKGASVISGDTSGQTGFDSGEEKIFSIVIDGETVSDKDQFFFFVYQMKNGEKHGASQTLIYSKDDVSKSQQKNNSKKTPKYYE